MTNSNLNGSESRKQTTQTLAAILRAVHSSLIQSLKKRREVQTGKEVTPVEWFHLLSGGPEYKWMHPLTQAMSDIDALLDNRTELSENDFAAVRDSLLKLFDADPSPEDFKNKYFDAMAADPELVLSHATLKKTLDQLPQKSVEGNAAEIRRSWHISERRLAHMRSTGKTNS